MMLRLHSRNPPTLKTDFFFSPDFELHDMLAFLSQEYGVSSDRSSRSHLASGPI